jgi:protein-histidine pros-kinase
MSEEIATKILLVDDEPANLFALQAVLEPLDLTLIVAHSGKDALRCLLQHEVALILLDVRMPDIDGYETAALIRERDKSKYTPIIFLTAFHAEKNDVARGYGVGAVDYIFKPFDADILRAKVNVFVNLYRMTGKLKKQEDDLLELHEVLKNAVEGISHLDADQRYLSVNSAFAKMIGCGTWEINGSPWMSTIHPGDRSLVEAAYRQMLNTEKAEVEARAVRADGMVRYHQMVLIKTSDDKGKFSGFYCFAKDITEQKHWEERSQLADIVESSNDAIVVTNLEGNVISWNPAAERIFGYSLAEVSGRTCSILVPPDRVDELANVIARFSIGERIKPFETVAIGKRGNRIDVSLSVSPVRDPAGNITGASFISRNITERKHLERELMEKNAELERAIRTKDRFLATISHELRTPLNAIIGFTGILLMRLSGALTDKQERQLQSIESSAQHLHMLINDLLDLSRIESGKVKLKFEPVNCNLLIDEVATTLRPLADKKGLNFEVRGLDADLTLVTDQRSLKQILINLISNGIKFTAEGCVNLVIMSSSASGEWVTQFSVVDSGIGIKTEDQLKLFRPFEQLDESVPSEGTGLGLYLSNKLSQLLGGRIEVESEFEKGSRFTLVLPHSPGGGDGSPYSSN